MGAAAVSGAGGHERLHADQAGLGQQRPTSKPTGMTARFWRYNAVRMRRPPPFSLSRPAAAALAALCLARCADPGTSAPPTDNAPVPTALTVDDVNLEIGTGGFGFMMGSAFVGAAVPRGLCKVGPDTDGDFGTVGFQHYSGYWFEDYVIQAFTHLHLHGTGLGDYGVLGVMPRATFADDQDTLPGNYASSFSKLTEAPRAGVYRVTLDQGPVDVEIAATAHGAHHRYTFNHTANTAHVVVDLDKHLTDGDVTDSALEVDAASGTLSGWLHHASSMSRGFGGYDVHFSIRAVTPVTAIRTWTDHGAPSPQATATGAGVGAVLDFDVTSSRTVELQVAISLVDLSGAQANLAAELTGQSFEELEAASRAAWNDVLGAVSVSVPQPALRRQMATHVYHAFLMPTRVADVDGRLRAVDGQIATQNGFHYVTDLSLWDTYRTLHPLLALLWPDDNHDTVQSLLHMMGVRGNLVRWPLAVGESGTMLGSPAEVVLADAHLKGSGGTAVAQAWPALRALVLDVVAPPSGRGTRTGSEPYIAQGYMPSSTSRSVSTTLEYAHDDFALANLARALGETQDADILAARAHGWRQLYDPAAGFLRERAAAGPFPQETLDPTAFKSAYAEANAWQSVWGAPHDVAGLIELMGGQQNAVTRLEQFFTLAAEDKAMPRADPLLFGAAPRPYFWPSNQPSIHTPYLFAQLGEPLLTQRWVRWTMDQYFGDVPAGLPGNDDGGTMGAWWVFSALGLYPLAGSTTYVVGAPRFVLSQLQVPGGTFAVEAPDVSADNLYVQAVTLNGAPLERPFVDHADLVAGGTLHFDMGPEPSAWGRFQP